MKRMQLLVIIIGATISVLLSHVISFNLDAKNAVRYDGPESSMFGFSVAGHRSQSNNWIIVGAPEGQTNQPGVTKGGTVYRCDARVADSCYQIQFDQKGATNFTGKPYDKKSYQWFGATVDTDGADSPIVACAPRYIWFSEKSTRRDPVGTCYISDSDLSNFRDFSPCRTKQHGYHRQGSCQAGFSAAISKKDNRVFIGAPGSWYWQGQLYSVDSRIKLPFYPPRNKSYGSGQVFQSALRFDKDIVYKTLESPPSDDDSYLGYSVALGDFNNDGQNGVAVGMPRGANLLGKVVLYSWNLTNIQNITGEQLGAYFGYAIISTDLDGDNFDDLIIGAPLYTTPNNDGKYEVGRVYVVYQGNEETRLSKGKFRRIQKLDGMSSRSRFGTSLAALGDINLDGYKDFAVGAPYDGPHQRGAIYIFHGSNEGASDKHAQVIYAEDISKSPVYTFGFSLSGGMDMDENNYPDLIVGAYSSNAAFVIKSKAIVKMSTSIEFDAASKQISLDEPSCTLRNQEPVPCTNVIVCMKYDGVGVQDTLVFDVQLILDSKKSKNPRLFFIERERQSSMNVTWRLTKGRKECQQKSVYIRENIRDKLTPMDAEIRYELVDSQYSDSDLVPVLDHNLPVSGKDSITVQKNCGSDNICVPDLKLTAKPNTDRYLLGSNEPLNFDVKVENRGEDSFETTFLMQLPSGINFVNTKRLEDSQNEIPVQCSTQNNNDNFTLKCDIGNPLPRNKVVHFNVLLEPHHVQSMAPSYDFKMLVNSTNPEAKKSVSDNRGKLQIDIWVETDLTVQGSSHPEEVHYNSTLYSNVTNIVDENEIGPQLVYIYNIRNNGPSTINEAEVYVLWPYQTVDGDDLIYLLDQIETSGPIKCQSTEFANYHGYKLDKKKSSLELHGITKTTTASRNHNGIVIDKVEEHFPNDNYGALKSDNYENSRKTIMGNRQRPTKFSTNLRNYLDLSNQNPDDEHSHTIKWSTPTDNGENSHHFRHEGHSLEVENHSGGFDDFGAVAQNRGFKTLGVDLNDDDFERNSFTTFEEKKEMFISGRSYAGRPQVDSEASISRLYDRSRRTRRQLPEDAISSDNELNNVLKCHSVKCTVFQCKTGPLNKEQEAWIALRSRINAKTLNKVFNGVNKSIELSSMVVARLSELPYIGKPHDRPLHKRAVIVKVTRTDTDPVYNVVPLWLIIVPIIAGILLILLLAYLLSKCGFFKRNRPQSQIPERQLLNRTNGYQHGDEQL